MHRLGFRLGSIFRHCRSVTGFASRFDERITIGYLLLTR